MALKLECVEVIPEGKRFVAYIQLQDGDKVIAKTALPYEIGGDIGSKAEQKFKARAEAWIEAKQQQEIIKSQINNVLSNVKIGGREG